MRLLSFLLLLSISIMADNPRVYSVLGDVVYDNVSGIVNLKNIDKFAADKEDILKYEQEVLKAKKDGFSLETDSKSVSKGKYLKKLRLLSKKNDYYLRSANSMLLSSIDSNNSKLFSQLINTGAIDSQRYKKEILEYYSLHKTDMNASYVIQNLINRDNMLKQEEAKAKKYSSKQSKESKNIQRIRENDRKKQAAIEKQLQKELEDKKSKIRKNQKEELSK